MQPATGDIQVFVKRALESRLDAGDLPDGGLLRAAKRVAIREELPAVKLKLTREALPERAGYEFYLMSEASAQRKADESRQPVPFIAVDEPLVTDMTGTVALGVDITLPRDSGLEKMCCCRARAHFERHENKWTFVKWSSLICS